MIQRTCKVCKETKDILEFRIANPEKGYIVYKCKSCEKLYNKALRLKRHPEKKEKVYKTSLEKRLKQKTYEDKYKVKREYKTDATWMEDLYQYIKEKNIFTEQELEVIYTWLKMVDKIGGKTKC